MDHAIFQLDLSVEAKSAYILLDNLSNSGRTPVTFDKMALAWTSTDQILIDALKELSNHGVIQKHQKEYTLLPSRNWI